MATISYSTLKKKVMARLWPNSDPDQPGPENLQTSLDAFFQSALAAVYQYNECLKDDQWSVFGQCSTYYHCGLTVLKDRPPGVIQDLFVVAADQCSPFTYTQKSVPEVREWMAGLQKLMTLSRRPELPVISAAVPLMPPLPLGFQYPTPDTDSKFGRALDGIWAIDGSRILVAPWLQSDESVVIHWAGTKGRWGPDDLLPDEITFEDALTHFVGMCYERDYGCNVERMTMYKQFHDQANGDLLWKCREETQIRATKRSFAEGQIAWKSYLAGETVVPPISTPSDAPVVVAFIADYGFFAADPTHPLAVATQIKSWKPNAIVTGGDNNYPGGGADTIDLNVGSLFRDRMFPYNGTQPLWPGEVDATFNQFWPGLGNHDWDGGQPYFDYFNGVIPNDPKVGQEGQPRFYEVVLGAMHFFVLNSGYDTAGTIHEPLGISGGSLQATWLQTRAALSTAPFKIVVLHHAPFTSSSNYTPGSPMLRWDFKTMGIDLILAGHGHNYERLEICNLPYIVCGASGAELVPMGTPIDGSLVRIDDHWGALRLTATCKGLTCEFVDEAGAVLDTLALEPDSNDGSPCTSPPPVVTRVATPVFSPSSGAFTNSANIIITSDTVAALIYYTFTTDGSDPLDPTNADTLYSGPIPITASTKFKAIGVKAGLANSFVAPKAYTGSAAAPTFSPTSGSFSGTVTVTLATTTPGGSMFYTLNGGSEIPYSAPFVLSATTVVNAVTRAAGLSDSPQSSKTYTAGAAAVAMYWGYSPLTILNAAQILALQNTADVTSPFRDIAFDSGSTVSDYFYVALDATLAVPRATDGFFDLSGLFPVAMATGSEGFTNGPTNGWSFLTVASVSGRTVNLFRSFFQLGSGTAQSWRLQ